MTTPTSTTAPRRQTDRSQTIIDWIQINARLIAVGAIIVALAGLIWWFMSKNQENRVRSANSALMRAKQSISAQNAALAQTDLQTVVSKYGDTGSGAEGALLLATLDYDQKKYAEGIAVLEKALQGGAAEPFQPRIRELMGDGYAAQNKLAEAAAEYEKAANAADPQVRKLEHAYQLGKAARAFEAAGKGDDAKRVWTVLSESDVPSASAEAKVRLAELNAEQPTK